MAAAPPKLSEDQPDGAVRVTLEGVTIENRGAYDVDLDLAELHGIYDCVGIAVRAPDGRRVDGDVLRRLRIAELVRRSAVWLEESGLSATIAAEMVPPRLLGAPMSYTSRWTGELVPAPMSLAEHEIALAQREKEYVEPAKAEAARFRRMVREAARAGRLEAAAAIYKRADRTNRPPTKAVQEGLGVTYDTAVGLVRRCRAAGLLPRTTKGAARASSPPKRRSGNGGS